MDRVTVVNKTTGQRTTLDLDSFEMVWSKRGWSLAKSYVATQAAPATATVAADTTAAATAQPDKES